MCVCGRGGCTLYPYVLTTRNASRYFHLMGETISYVVILHIVHACLY